MKVRAIQRGGIGSDTILSQLEGQKDNDAEIKSQLNKWSRLQWGRTLLGLAAFTTTLCITYKRRS